MRPEGIRPAEDPLQPLEAMERQGGLRPEDGRAAAPFDRSEDGDDRCNLPEGAPLGDQPAAEKGDPAIKGAV